MHITRRSFLATSAASAAALSARAQPASQPASTPKQRRFHLNFAPHFGMFQNHAPDDLDQISFAADQGFTAWEDNWLSHRPVEEQERIAARLQKCNIQMGIFVCHSIDWDNPTLSTGDKAIRDKFVSEVKASTEVAKRMNATWVTTGVGRVAQNLPHGHQFANIVEALKQAAAAAEPSGMVMVVEPLNWRDHPGQFAATSDTLYALIKAVGSPSCKILQDLYHLQVTEGNLMDNMDRCWDEIRYIQTGDNPGRCEPGTGEVNYKNVFRHIRDKGFTGILGMEHGNSKPGKEGELAVIEAYAAADAD